MIIIAVISSNVKIFNHNVHVHVAKTLFLMLFVAFLASPICIIIGKFHLNFSLENEQIKIDLKILLQK